MINATDRNAGVSSVPETWRTRLIRFRQPGRGTLYARFEIAPDELDAIRAELEGAGKIDKVFQVELTSADGAVHASVEKTLHIARRGLERNARATSSAPNHGIQATGGVLGGAGPARRAFARRT